MTTVTASIDTRIKTGMTLRAALRAMRKAGHAWHCDTPVAVLSDGSMLVPCTPIERVGVQGDHFAVVARYSW